GHARERQIELGGIERGLDRSEGGLGDRRVRGETLEFLTRRRLLREQPLGTVAIRASHLELGPRALALGREARDLGLERARIDQEQKLSLLDAAAFLEVHGLDVPADPRADLDAARGLETPGEIGPVLQIL